MAMPPHKPSVFAGCRNKQQKTAWLRGFLPKYLFGFLRMALPCLKDAWDRLGAKNPSIYAALRAFEKPSHKL